MKTGIYNATFEDNNKISVEIIETTDALTPGIFIPVKKGFKTVEMITVSDDTNLSLTRTEIANAILAKGYDVINIEKFSNPI